MFVIQDMLQHVLHCTSQEEGWRYLHPVDIYMKHEYGTIVLDSFSLVRDAVQVDIYCTVYTPRHPEPEW